MESPATLTSANHNKYCHFCQHVKVRASSMLACQNPECCRRFCEHCLVTHLNEDVDPMSSCAWSLLDGKPVWHCPICRKKCCCSQSDCKQDHRHCKAYRYRRRRAELATKRMSASSTLGSAEKRIKKAAKEGKGKGSCASGTIMRPALTFGFVRSAERTNSDESIDSPPSFVEGSMSFPCNNRPRREAALKGRYTYGDESEDDDIAVGEPDMDGGEECDDNIDTPAAREPDDEGFECHVMETAAPHQGLIGNSGMSTAENVPGDLWTMEESRSGACGFGEDAGDEDEHSESLADDVLGGIYGHMSHARDSYMHGDYELGGVSTAGAAGDLPVLDGEEGGEAGAGETDEARWIRRTYETVYNPAARQRALQALTSDLNLGGQKTFSLPPPGRYPLDEGELFFLSSSRALGASRDGEKPAGKPGDANSASPSDGSDLSYFLQSHGAQAKFPRADIADQATAGSTKKCTVVYDFQ